MAERDIELREVRDSGETGESSGEEEEDRNGGAKKVGEEEESILRRWRFFYFEVPIWFNAV